MAHPKSFWVHEATYLYREDPPVRPLETIWTAHPGWGYLKRKDLWIERTATEAELQEQGFSPRRPVNERDVILCPSCGMYMNAIPGHMIDRHVTACGGGGENQSKMEEGRIDQLRIEKYEAKLQEARDRALRELIEGERRERMEKAKEEAQARQATKDRKKRLKDETRKRLRGK
jgi:hypothetical protein